MKKLLLLLIGCWPFLMCQAQDVLVKRNGDELQVKVQEITQNEIKYKRYDYLDGPLISISKADVFMVKYENGTRDVFTEATKPALATPQALDPYFEREHLKLSGPRVGFTILSQRLIDKIGEDNGRDLNPFMTQFGWQFETRMFSFDNGVTGLFEFVPLIGGLEQGKFLPSLSALIGLRGAKGFEFGLGPNVSLAGAGVVFAAGTNFQTQGVNFPVNLAFVPSKDGSRISLLFGFNSRR